MRGFRRDAGRCCAAAVARRYMRRRCCHGWCRRLRTRRIKQDGELAHALAGVPVHFDQQVEIGVVHRHAAGDADRGMVSTGIGDTEMQRNGGTAASNAGAGEVVAGSQLDGEALQLRRIGRMQRDFRQQRLPQRRFDLDLAQVQRHRLSAAQCQRHQYRQLQRTIHYVLPRTIPGAILGVAAVTAAAPNEMPL